MCFHEYLYRCVYDIILVQFSQHDYIIYKMFLLFISKTQEFVLNNRTYCRGQKKYKTLLYFLRKKYMQKYNNAIHYSFQNNWLYIYFRDTFEMAVFICVKLAYTLRMVSSLFSAVLVTNTVTRLHPLPSSIIASINCLIYYWIEISSKTKWKTVIKKTVCNMLTAKKWFEYLKDFFKKNGNYHSVKPRVSNPWSAGHFKNYFCLTLYLCNYFRLNQVNIYNILTIAVKSLTVTGLIAG